MDDRSTMDFAALQTTYRDYVAQLQTIVARHPFGESVASEVQQLHDAVNQFTVFVPLVGGFSTGKSSLLNAWLGESLLPTAIQPATDCGCALRYIDDPNGEHLEETSDPTTNTVIWRDYWRHHPKLGAFPQVVLVDMPGMGSSNALHEHVVHHVMAKAVAFVVCVVATKPITSDVLYFLRERTEYGLPTVALITQYDLLPPTDRLQVLNHLQDQLAAHSIEVVFVGQVSARKGDLAAWETALNALSTQIPAIFVNRFRDRLHQQSEYLLAHLRFLSNPRHSEAHQWEHERDQLTEQTARFHDLWQRTRHQFLQIGVQNAAIEVAQRMIQQLTAQQSLLIDMMIQEQDIQDFVRDTLTMACQHHGSAGLKTVFFQHFGPLIGELSLPDHAIDMEVQTLNAPTFTTSIIGQFAGFIADIIGYRWPMIGAILRQMEKEIRTQRHQQAQRAFHQFIQQLHSDLPAQLRPHLDGLGTQWVQQAEARCLAELQARQHHLDLLQTELAQDAERRHAIAQQRQADQILLEQFIQDLSKKIQ